MRRNTPRYLLHTISIPCRCVPSVAALSLFVVSLLSPSFSGSGSGRRALLRFSAPSAASAFVVADRHSSNNLLRKSTSTTSVSGVRRCLDQQQRRDTAIMAGINDGQMQQSGCDPSTGAEMDDKVKASASTSAAAGSPVVPPQPRRDESAYLLAGSLQSFSRDQLHDLAGLGAIPTDYADLPRQPEDSTNALLEPPKQLCWMRSDDRSSQEVLDHLKAENDYTTAIMGNLLDADVGLRDVLYKELVGRLQETDYTTPSPDGQWYYYRRTFEGKSYPVHVRAPVVGGEGPQHQYPISTWDAASPDAATAPILPNEEVYLDENALAEGHDYCATGSVAESPSHDLVAYAVDFSGDETYELYVKDIVSEEVVDHPEGLEIDSTVRWGADDSTLYYLKMDDQHRPYQVYRRTLSTGTAGDDANDAAANDELLFEEPDDLFWVGISKSADKKYLFIETSSSETSEVHYLDLTKGPDASLECIAKRRKKVLYDVEHREGQWLITTNWSGELVVGEGANTPTSNMRLMRCRATPDSEGRWRPMRDNMDEIMFDGGADRALDHVNPFWRHAVVIGREGGIPRVWIVRFGEEECNLDIIDLTRLDFPETSYDVGIGPNYEYRATKIILSYDSLVTPLESVLVDMDEPNNLEGRVVLKKKNVPGYDREQYACDRTTVLSRDGETMIPVSLVYRKDVMEEYTANGKLLPTHLYGYGSYGSNVEDDFDSTRLPLLDRGMVYVIAHVRGGGEMGRQWYEEPKGAKYLCKTNTFDDFIDVARWLVNDKKLTIPEKLSCEGRSAGGLLIGASLNQSPELFGVAILGVPFVDVVSTMIDASIPLTAGEWEEWGCPNEEKFFDYMMSYCPMHNVQKSAKYPSMLLTAGLNDPRVQYWGK